MARDKAAFTKTIEQVQSNPSDLTALSLTDRKLDHDDCQRLATALQANTHLQKLDLSRNQDIDNEGLKHFSFHTTAINVLALWEIELKKITPLFAADLKNSKLIKLSLGGNRLKDKDAAVLAAHLPPSLLALNLAQNDLTHKGVSCFKDVPLVSFNAAQNKLDDKAGIALAANPYLSTLNLYHNKLSDRTLEALARNCTITTLNIFLNENITVAGVRNFVDQNTTVTTLLVWMPDPVEAKYVTDRLQRNQANAKLFLEACKTGVLADVQALLTPGLVSPYAIERTFGNYEPEPTDSLNTGLILAVLHQQYEVAAYLVVNYPYLLNMRNKDNFSAEDLATAKADTDMVKILKGEPLPAELQQSKASARESSTEVDRGISERAAAAAADIQVAFPKAPPANTLGRLVAEKTITSTLDKKKAKAKQPKAEFNPQPQRDDYILFTDRDRLGFSSA